jgi:hypothetical protein
MGEEKKYRRRKFEQRIRKYDLEARKQIQDGDVLMYSGRRWVSLLIRFFTWSRFSHAGIVVRWNDRLMVMESIWPMVILNPISYSLGRYKGGVDHYSCNEEEIPPENRLDADRRLKMIKFAQKELGRPYSLRKLISFLFGVFFKRKTTEEDRLKRYETEFTCSEYVARVYNYIGLDLMKDRADRFTTPKNIANSRYLKYLWTLKKE